MDFILFYFPSHFYFFLLFNLFATLGLGFSMISQVAITNCHGHTVTQSCGMIEHGRHMLTLRETHGHLG